MASAVSVGARCTRAGSYVGRPRSEHWPAWPERPSRGDEPRRSGARRSDSTPPRGSACPRRRGTRPARSAGRDHSGRSARPAGRPRVEGSPPTNVRTGLGDREFGAAPPMSGARRCRPRRRDPHRRRGGQARFLLAAHDARTDCMSGSRAWRRGARNALRSRGSPRGGSRDAAGPPRASQGRARSRYRRTAASVRLDGVRREACAAPRALAEARDGLVGPQGDEPGRRIRTRRRRTRDSVLVPRSMPAQELQRHLERAEARPKERGDGGPEGLEPDWLCWRPRRPASPDVE